MKLFSPILLAATVAGAALIPAFAGVGDGVHPEVNEHNVDLRVMMPMRPAQLNKILSASRSSSPLSSPSSARSGALAVKAPFAGGFNLCGAMLNSSEWTGSVKPYGIYSAVSDSEGVLSVTPVALDPLFDATAGACMTPEGYFITGAKQYMGYYIVDHYLFNPSDWSLKSKTAGDMESMARSLTCVGTTLYGSYVNLDGSFSFSSYDIKKLTKKKIVARMEHPYSALAADEGGTIYAIDFEGNLLTVDKKTGKEELIAELGLPSQYTTSAVMNPAGDRIYYVQARPDASEIFAIDPAAGEAVSLGVYANGEQWSGLFLAAPEAFDAAPALPADMSVNFENGALDGTLSFTLPATLFDGNPAAGEMTWTVTVDGLPSSEGAGEAGSAVETPVAVGVAGSHRFEVRCANEAGEGPVASIERYVGPDAPQNVTGVNFSVNRETGEVSLSWTAPRGGQQGNWFDPSQLAYDILDAKGEKVATGLTETEWHTIITLPEKETVLYYSVLPLHAGIAGTAVLSNKVSLGEITLPYEHSFKGTDALEGFNVVDYNGDGITWTADPAGSAYVSYSSVSMNDWIISSPIYLKKGWVYPVTLDAWSQTARHDERIAFWLGKGNRREDMETRYLYTILDGHPDPFRFQVTVDEDGYYNFGIQGCSLPAQYYLRLDEVAIGEPYLQSAPSAPAFSSVIPDPDGKLDLSGYIFISSKAADGSPQNSLDRFVLKRGDKVVRELINPRPGTPLNFSDTFDEPGRYEYTAYVEADNGKSEVTNCNVYVGVNVPANPSPAVVSTENGISLRWKAPTKGADGLHLNTSDLTYHIYDAEFNEIGTTDGLSYDVELPEKSPVPSLWYVKAESSAGLNPSWECMTPIYNHGCHEDGLFTMDDIWDFPILSYKRKNGSIVEGEGWIVDGYTGGGLHKYWTWLSPLNSYYGDDADECILIFPSVVIGDDSAAAWFDFAGKAPEEKSFSAYAIVNDTWYPLSRITDSKYVNEASLLYDLSLFAGDVVNVAVVARPEEGEYSYLRLGRAAIEYRQKLSVRLPVDEEVYGSHAPGHTEVGVRVVNYGKEAPAPFEIALYSAATDAWQEDSEYTKVDAVKVETLGADGAEEYVTCNLPLPQRSDKEEYSCYYFFRIEGLAGNDSRYQQTWKRSEYVKNLGFPAPRSLHGVVNDEMTEVKLMWDKPARLDENDCFTTSDKAYTRRLTCYRLYADGEYIGETTGTEFIDKVKPEDIIEPSSRTYQAIAVYEDSESFPGVSCLIKISGVDTPMADSDDTGLRAGRTPEGVVIYGATGTLRVYTPAGEVLAVREAAGEPICLMLRPGIYVLTDGKASIRVRL